MKPTASTLLLLIVSISCASAQDNSSVEQPPPIVPGAKVVTLWPPNSPMLKNLDQKEAVFYSKDDKSHILRVTNINNPSIELHLAPSDKANGVGIIVAAGGANKELWVGPEGADVAKWLNSIGISAFVLRYRLQPYSSSVDALADSQRAIRLIRANAKEWNVDPAKVGFMGFSAGGEQAARVALNFDSGKPDATDPVDRLSDRPDFTVLVYAGWRQLDLSHVPADAPPAFLTCAGKDDPFHAKETVQFYDAFFDAKIPVELHIYSHGGHGGSIQPRKGIPFGTWHLRFVEWLDDLPMMKKAE
jgi:endo-1,4-beta-xylanase